MRFIFALCAFLPALVCAQAVVNEAQESAFVYVDTAVGSDSNPGTSSQPLQTISAGIAIAISNNKLGTGTRVIVNPGIYRESISISPGQNATSVPMTVQAATNGTVFVSGAVPYRNWAASGSNSNVFTTPWANQWGFCPSDGGNAPLEQNIVLRREMVFVNGASMTQVLSVGQMVAPGTFYVDETGGTLYLWPPSGTDMASADVEVGTLPQLMTIAASGANPLNGVVIRGITFEYSTPCHANGAVTVSGKVSNLIFDSVAFLWNNGQGLSMTSPATNITVVNSTSNHNGATGFQAFQLKNVLWQNVEGSYNNWRGAQGAYYSWNTGGMHIFSDHTETLAGAKVLYNQTHGIHWDTDDANITADSIVSSQNAVGILNEKNEGPLIVTNSLFCSSFSVAAGYAGFVQRNSDNTTLTGNIFYNNNIAQLLVTGVVGGIQVTNWETNQVYNLITQHLTFDNNIVVGIGTQQLFKDGSIGGSDWTSFVSTLDSDGNTWWNATDSTPFIVPYPQSGTQDTFAQWQSATNQDQHSVFAPPAVDPSIACAVAADMPDLQLLVDNGVVTADPSGTAVFNLQTAALGGLNGAVNLYLDGVTSLPGASVTLSDSSIGVSDTSVLTFSSSASTPPATYTFTVLANTAGITRAVTLSATVPTIIARVSTTSLTFANQPVNGTSAPQTVTLTNNGTTRMSVTSITVGAGFSQTNNCGSVLAVGASCAINVTFAPKSVTTYTTSMMINDSAPGSPQVISITGTVVGSPTMTLSVKSLSFGNQVFLKPSTPQNVTLTNSGTAVMNISSIALTGTNPTDFTIQTNTCGPTLAVSANCTVSVTFVPTALNKRTASLTITDDAAGSPQAVTLSGSGTTAITVTPKSLTFSSTSVGSISASKTVTLTNLSSAALPVATSLIGANPGDFTSTNCGTTLAGGGTCVITLTFAPQLGGARSATLSIVDPDPTSPQLVTMTGTGNALTFTPKTLSFSSTKVGNTAAGKTVTITNLSAASVPITSIVITGDFAQTNTCGTSIGGSTSCTITVTFTPTATGSRSGTLTITDPDPTSPQKVTLTGTGS